MSDRYARYRSIGATGTSSSPRTVHDSRDEIGEMTRATCIVPPRALPPGRLQITTSSTQNQRPRPCVSDIKDTAQRPPDNDGVGGAQVDPVLGGVFVELQQGVEVFGDLGDRLRILGAVVEFEGLGRDLGLVDVFGVVDVLERGQPARVC